MRKQKELLLFSVKLVGFLGLVVLVMGFLVAAKPGVQPNDEQETCSACHEEAVLKFAANPHTAAGEASCTACHGSADKHLEEGGGANIFAYKASDLPNEKSKMCLSCHTKTNARFLAGPHGKAAMDCTSCHSIHAGKASSSLLKTNATKSCATCHEDIFSQFQLNERHRLQEGIMSCATCHNPHEPAARERLGGFKHESCLRCHTDKGGPFLYEHGSSRVEGCTSCHEVHGSPNRHLLTQQSISDLCFSCHTFAPAFHSRFDSRTSNCTSCHATIHGSNLSRIFLK